MGLAGLVPGWLVSYQLSLPSSLLQLDQIDTFVRGLTDIFFCCFGRPNILLLTVVNLLE